MTWDFLDGGGQAPTGAADRPGEHFVFAWSTYRDVLTLKTVPGEVSPENFFAKPWKRTSATPQRDSLDSACGLPATALSR
jgi:hypothetical protein